MDMFHHWPIKLLRKADTGLVADTPANFSGYSFHAFDADQHQIAFLESQGAAFNLATTA